MNKFFSSKELYIIDQILLTNNQKDAFTRLISYMADNPNKIIKVISHLGAKDILINNHNKSLPHWILAVASTHPQAVQAFLADNQLRETLNSDEFEFLRNNFSLIASQI